MGNQNKAIATTNSGKEVAEVQSGYLMASNALNEGLAEQIGDMAFRFSRIKVPAGGGLAFEVAGDDANNPDSVKEIKGVIVHANKINAYFKDKYTGSKNAPDCASKDGKTGIDSDGVVKSCKTCPLNDWDSGENGGKACKNMYRVFILQEGDIMPMILTIPPKSVDAFDAFRSNLLTHGKMPFNYVWKFSLKKATNTGGIVFSEVIYSLDRELRTEEKTAIRQVIAFIKKLAEGDSDVAGDEE